MTLNEIAILNKCVGIADNEGLLSEREMAVVNDALTRATYEHPPDEVFAFNCVHRLWPARYPIHSYRECDDVQRCGRCGLHEALRDLREATRLNNPDKERLPT